MAWHVLFRRLVVLVGALDGAVHADEAGIDAPGLGENLVQSDLVSGNPAAVQPQDVQRAEPAVGNLRYLIPGVVHVGLPPVRMHLLLIVDTTVGRGVIGIPKAWVVPVRLGEVGSGHESPLPECVEDMPGHIPALIGAERSRLGDGKVRPGAVIHAEAVVVLGGENHVLHSGAPKDIGPLCRIEIHRVEHLGQAPVPLLVALVGAAFRPHNPVLVAYIPGFHDAGHRIQAPVHQNAEFQVLPPVQFLQHGRVCGPLVAVGRLMHGVFLRQSSKRKGNGQNGCK